MNDINHIPIDNYFSDNPRKMVYCINCVPNFSPLDINLKFLNSNGWSINTDRIRFHTETKMEVSEEHPMAQIFAALKPHLLIRKIDKEEDYFISIQVMIDGNIKILSNDSNKATEYLCGIFLEFPPSFKEIEDISQESLWNNDETIFAMFLGMLYGAYGWIHHTTYLHSLKNPFRKHRSRWVLGTTSPALSCAEEE